MSKSRKEQIEEMLALAPNDSFLRYGLTEDASAGQDEEAAKCLRELLARDPDYVAAYLQAGRTLIRLGEDSEACAVLRTGITIARQAGDEHAAGEMAGFLATVEEGG